MSDFVRFKNAPKEYTYNVRDDTPPTNDKDFQQKKLSPLAKFAVRALLVMLIIYLAYLILVHPVDKLYFQLWLTQNCEMSTKYHSPKYSQRTGNIKIDKNVLRGPDGTFYEIDGDQLYIYKYGEKSLYGTVEDFIGDSFSISLFDKDNYHLVWDDGFVWQLKGDIDITPFEKVHISQNIFSSIIIKFYYDNYNNDEFYKMTIHKFGFVDLDLPEEK